MALIQSIPTAIPLTREAGGDGALHRSSTSATQKETGQPKYKDAPSPPGDDVDEDKDKNEHEAKLMSQMAAFK